MGATLFLEGRRRLFAREAQSSYPERHHHCIGLPALGTRPPREQDREHLVQLPTNCPDPRRAKVRFTAPEGLKPMKWAPTWVRLAGVLVLMVLAMAPAGRAQDIGAYST